LREGPRYIVETPRESGTEPLPGHPREHAMNFDADTIDGYAVPVDPMDLLQCDSCQ
jgi:hypothetical protein